jgi:hypothetical protein
MDRKIQKYLLNTLPDSEERTPEAIIYPFKGFNSTCYRAVPKDTKNPKCPYNLSFYSILFFSKNSFSLFLIKKVQPSTQLSLKNSGISPGKLS